MEYIQVKPVEPGEDLEGAVADEEAAAAEVGEEELEVGGPRTLATLVVLVRVTDSSFIFIHTDSYAVFACMSYMFCLIM